LILASDQWQRPVDWRWVNYPEQLADNVVLSLRAITALCSEEAIAPRDAATLNALVRDRLSPAQATGDSSLDICFDVEAMQAAKAKGKSHVELSIANDHVLLTAAAPDAKRFFAELESKLDLLIESAQRQGAKCKRCPGEGVAEFISVVLTDRNRMNVASR
jgi:hypothetical protein